MDRIAKIQNEVLILYEFIITCTRFSLTKWFVNVSKTLHSSNTCRRLNIRAAVCLTFWRDIYRDVFNWSKHTRPVGGGTAPIACRTKRLSSKEGDAKTFWRLWAADVQSCRFSAVDIIYELSWLKCENHGANMDITEQVNSMFYQFHYGIHFSLYSVG